MSEKYYYTKVIDAEVLDEAIKLRTSLRSIYLSGRVEFNCDGTAGDDNIELEFDRALLSTEQDELTTLINSIDSSYDLVVRKGIERNTMTWAMSQGRAILAQFSSNNLYRQKTDEQTEALLSDYPDLIHSLVTGSLQSAYRNFATMVANDNISQDEIDEFTLRLQIILGF